jgi:23S rRNA (pseudouridine1915-N3)-methyltransferase
MKVHVWAFGAPSDAWISEGEKIFQKRIERYLPFEYKTHQLTKGKQQLEVLNAEAKWIKQQIEISPALLILLDEKGTAYDSVKFSKKLDQWRQGTHKRLIFLIGSAYGFDKSTYALSQESISLSAMTFPHQICRLMFLEQLYRACTILKGESYHHA